MAAHVGVAQGGSPVPGDRALQRHLMVLRETRHRGGKGLEGVRGLSRDEPKRDTGKIAVVESLQAGTKWVRRFHGRAFPSVWRAGAVIPPASRFATEYTKAAAKGMDTKAVRGVSIWDGGGKGYAAVWDQRLVLHRPAKYRLCCWPKGLAEIQTCRRRATTNSTGDQSEMPRSPRRSRKRRRPSPIRLAIDPRGMPIARATSLWVQPSK